MEFDAEQVEHGIRRIEVDVARLARQHAIEPQRRDQPARLALALQGLLPVQPVHADHQPLLGLPPDDVGGLHLGILHMRGDHREVFRIERDQAGLSGHGSTDVSR